MRFSKLATAICIGFFAVKSALAIYTPEALADKVEWKDLPGAEDLNATFNQFAGYVTIDEKTGKQYFYWFFESQNHPESDPVILWTNGGPGCSGFLGLLSEHGPIRPDAQGKLTINPFAWNLVSNMIFIEQPTGVGFSYSKTQSDYNMGDAQAAKDNHIFMKNWLKKFPQFRQNDFHITSESYGGHYMPTLAYEIVTNNPAGEDHINFKGFAVGNPYTDDFSNNLGQYQKYYGEQILPKPVWDKYYGSCSTRQTRSANHDACIEIERGFDEMIGNLNPYALDYPVCDSQGSWLIRRYRGGKVISYEPCEEDYAGLYLNKPEVKAAIHARADIKWVQCSTTTSYNTSDMAVPMMPYYKTLIDNYDLNILVFSGDDDAVCSTESTQYWIWDLGYQIHDFWKVWQVAGQVAGYYTTFEKNFAFVTVHGAGHEVPAYRPERALQLFKNYLSGSWFHPTSNNIDLVQIS